MLTLHGLAQGEEIDYSDIPPLGDNFFTRARVVITPTKRAEYIRLDPDLRTWFEEHDQDYPALINLILRRYVEIQTELGE